MTNVLIIRVQINNIYFTVMFPIILHLDGSLLETNKLQCDLIFRAYGLNASLYVPFG